MNQAMNFMERDTASTKDEEAAARVARISFLEGDVGFLRAGVDDWVEAVANLPLLAGDQLYTSQGARAELQLARGNYIRLAENTALTISALSLDSVQFEVSEGTLLVRIEKLREPLRQFEVNTPHAALCLKREGLYRINVRADVETEVIARRGAAEVTTVEGHFELREGQRLLVENGEHGRLEISSATPLDEWDDWSQTRDTYINQIINGTAPVEVAKFEDEYDTLYGVSELSSYGTWRDDAEYGACWVPRVSSGWAPYRTGQWLWVPAVGWTWLADEPWGWAPYYYGRWVFLNNIGWAWVPGFGSRYHSYGPWYYRWRPALVSFFYCPTSHGDYIGWYPLAPGERWRRLDRWDANHDHLRYPGVRDGWQRPDQRPSRQRNGISVQPVDGFTNPDRNRFRPDAPGRDLSIAIEKTARPGLPGLKPGKIASQPLTRLRAGDSSPKKVAPPVEVLKRPVITRNRPTDPRVAESAPRERRVVKPRKPKEGRVIVSLPAPVPAAGGSNNAGEASGKSGASNREEKPAKQRPSRPVFPLPSAGGDQSGNTSGNEERKAKEKAKEKEREKKEPRETGNRRPKPEGDSSGGVKQPKEKKPSADQPRTEVPRVAPKPKERSNDKPSSGEDRKARRPENQRPQSGSSFTERPRPEKRSEPAESRQPRRKGNG